MTTSKTRRVLTYCGAAPGSDPAYVDAARVFGEVVGARGAGIVYGGHHAGMMGAVAEGCRARGGSVLGILPDVLEGKEHPRAGIELLRVPDMHTRKTRMVEHADFIVALRTCMSGTRSSSMPSGGTSLPTSSSGSTPVTAPPAARQPSATAPIMPAWWPP